MSESQPSRPSRPSRPRFGNLLTVTDAQIPSISTQISSQDAGTSYICRFCNTVGTTDEICNSDIGQLCHICRSLPEQTLRHITENTLNMCACCRSVYEPNDRCFQHLRSVSGSRNYTNPLTFSVVTVNLCNVCTNILMINATIINSNSPDIRSFGTMIQTSRKAAVEQLCARLREIIPGMNDPLYIIFQYLYS